MGDQTEMARIIDYVFGDREDQPKNVRNGEIAFVLKEMEIRAQDRDKIIREALFGNGKVGLLDRVKKLEWVLKPAQIVGGGILGGIGLWVIEKIFQ